MRIILLNTHDQTGGAARACHRLFRGLAAAEQEVTLLVREKSHRESGATVVGANIDGRLRALMDGLPLHSYPQSQLHNFSPDWVPGKAVKETIRRHPHVVNLHWVVQGFVHIDALS